MKLKWVFSIAAVLLIFTGCSSKAALPAEIKVNQDECDTCHMGIQDLESAAQIILNDGKPLLFDDIGCLFVYLQEEQPEYEAAFVHDFQTKEWISLDKSTFVQDEGIESPMSYGIAAFETAEKASDFQKNDGGTIYTKEELKDLDIKAFKKGDMTHSH
jgi:copper chaperone NosL